ncbi:MAG: hypothetical protein GF390_01985 [Candidatus Pacebacteria bacterium]|nr:hypothetical protein [Candidatus Paceibacterota bacterium]
MKKNQLVVFILSLALILFFWKNTLLNFDNSLYDWNDSLYTIWIIENNLGHFKNLNLQSLYDTSAMYSFKYSLSFAEHLFFPSLLLLPISYVVDNPIALLNFWLIINHLLVYVSSYVLIKSLAKNTWAALIAAFYFSFSPYFISQLGHIHMITSWPLMLSLHALLQMDATQKTRHAVFAGMLAGLQFTTTMYLGIMNLVVIGLYLIADLTLTKNWQKVLQRLAIILSAFLIIAAISIYGYLAAQKTYSGNRELSEYILYSAHLTDYLFTDKSQNSLLYQHALVKKWNNYNHHVIGERAVFIGFLPSLLLIYFFLKIKPTKQNIKIFLTFNKKTFFIILLLITGFIFSLGPRLNVNGAYVHLPLPYLFLLKYLPLSSALRALGRWYFLVCLGTTLTLGLAIARLLNQLQDRVQRLLIAILLIIITVVEFFPQPLPAVAKTWWHPADQYLKTQLCSEKKAAILEYPFVYRSQDANLIKDLQYKTNILLTSTQHDCQVLSGFSGYEPLRYQQIKKQLDDDLTSRDAFTLIKELNLSYLKLNKFALFSEEIQPLMQTLKQLGFQSIYEDHQVVIYQVP